MLSGGNDIILNVREKSEYDSGHIKSAILLPVGNINADTATAVIDIKDCVVLIYCRNDSRSKKAAATLAKLGYTNIYEFGGITSWKHGVEY